jgi:hypothetical protein
MHELQKMNAMQSRGIVHRPAVFHRSVSAPRIAGSPRRLDIFPSATNLNAFFFA